MKTSLANILVLLFAATAAARYRKPPGWDLCSESPCQSGLTCFTPRKNGPFKGKPDVCGVAVDGPVCNEDLICELRRAGVICHEKKCYKAAQIQAFGEACDFNRICGTELECSGDRCLRAKDSACREGSECAFGLPCTEGQCKVAEIGEPCNSRSHCSMDAYCSAEGVCRPAKLDAGGPCRAAEVDSCGGGLQCIDGKCDAPALGQACEDDGDSCADNLICVDKKCAYKLKPGDPCTSSFECAVFTCYDGICQGGKSTDKECTKDGECAAGKLCSVQGKCCTPNQPEC